MSIADATYAVPLRTDEDGVIRVGGTRVTLDTVIGAYKGGADAEEMAWQYPRLDLADVHMVIGHYLRHREEVEAYLAQGQRQAEEVRRLIESQMDPHGIRDRLLARKAEQERGSC